MIINGMSLAQALEADDLGAAEDMAGWKDWMKKAAGPVAKFGKEAVTDLVKKKIMGGKSQAQAQKEATEEIAKAAGGKPGFLSTTGGKIAVGGGIALVLLAVLMGRRGSVRANPRRRYRDNPRRKHSRRRRRPFAGR